MPRSFHRRPSYGCPRHHFLLPVKQAEAIAASDTEQVGAKRGRRGSTGEGDLPEKRRGTDINDAANSGAVGRAAFSGSPFVKVALEVYKDFLGISMPPCTPHGSKVR